MTDSTDGLNIKPFTNEEICKRVKAEFKQLHMTYEIAAQKLESSKQSVSNQLSGKRRFSIDMAARFHKAFGFSEIFLIKGVGDLYGFGEQSLTNVFEFFNTVPENLKTISNYELAKKALDILNVLNDKVAIECYNSYLAGNLDESNELYNILKTRYFADLEIHSDNPKSALVYLGARKFYSKAELESAKELTRLESIAFNGGTIDVEAQVNRFRKKLEEIKKNYENDDVTDYNLGTL